MKKRPRYYHSGRYSNIPDSTLESIRPFVESNPHLDKQDLFRLNGDILSEMEFKEVIEYITNNPKPTIQ